MQRSGKEVIVYSGVRAAESPDRAKLPATGFDDMFGCEVSRPLLNWTIDDVVALHKKYDIPLNPLYGYGARRVGCFPCINSNKAEIKLISIHFPERIDQIREQERSFGDGVLHSFFAAKTVPPRFRTHSYTNKDGKTFDVCTIDDVVKWSHTGKRARPIEPGLFDFDDDQTLVCPIGRGFCE